MIVTRPKRKQSTCNPFVSTWVIVAFHFEAGTDSLEGDRCMPTLVLMVRSESAAGISDLRDLFESVGIFFTDLARAAGEAPPRLSTMALLGDEG